MKSKQKAGLNTMNKVILIVTTIALAAVAVFLFVTRPREIDSLYDTYLDTLDEDVRLSELIEPSFKEVYKVKEFTYYGESLKFYHKKDLVKVDDMLGKNVVLHNVETGEEITYTYSNGAEDGIMVGQLKPGFYEVYIYDKFVKKRLYFDKETHVEPFETLRRNEKSKHVQIDASKDFLSKYGIHMDRNYVFISVTETIPMAQTIDVLIDPCGNTYNPNTNTTTTGISVGSVSEQKDAYALALKVKEDLEAYGLKVELTRDENGDPSYYGKDGRVGQGYMRNAKIYISLGFLQDKDVDRPLIVASPYTSASFANNVSYYMQKYNLEMYGVNGGAGSLYERGVVLDGYIQDEEKMEESIYEELPQLRESGGKVTFCGVIENAKENQRYQDCNGMYAIYIQFCNAYSEDSVLYYKSNMDMMAHAIADGTISYFEIEGENFEANSK